MTKKEAPDVCPGCGGIFSEPEWGFNRPVADWITADGQKFHGNGCLKKYHDKLASLEAAIIKTAEGKP